MPKKSPYAPELIEKCIELYKAGVPTDTIAKNSGVPSRTLYRWIQVNCKGKRPIDPDRISSDPNFEIALQAKAMPHDEAVNWLENLEALQTKLSGIHTDLIDDLHHLLQMAISCPDPSPRTINSLSLTLDRHCQAAMRLALQGRDKQVDVGQAISVLEGYGFAVFDSAKLSEIFSPGEEDNPFEPVGEDEGEEP